MNEKPKFINAMKVSAFFLFLCVFSAFASETGSLNARTDISGNNSTEYTNPDSPQKGKTLTGVVTDKLGPVAGANIIIKGTTNGTITDADGKYVLSDVPSGAVLQISYIGYLTKEVPVGSQSQIDVTLLEDTQALEEVVVVGYGTMKKKDLKIGRASCRERV